MGEKPDTTDGQQQQQGSETQAGQQQGQQEQTFEQWLQAQPEDVRTRYSEHTSGLRSALEAERSSRKTLEKQIKDATRGLDENSDVRKQLDSLSAKLRSTETQTQAYEALQQGGATNLRLAYLAAQDAGLIDDRGALDVAALKTKHPELFKAVRTPAGNAGNGTGSQPPAATGLNAFIRRQSGRG